MAKAYQCDRCLWYYSANKDVIPRGLPTDKVAKGVKIVTVQDNVARYYELCDDCLRKLMDFLEYRDNLKEEGVTK